MSRPFPLVYHSICGTRQSQRWPYDIVRDCISSSFFLRMSNHNDLLKAWVREVSKDKRGRLQSAGMYEPE